MCHRSHTRSHTTRENTHITFGIYLQCMKRNDNGKKKTNDERTKHTENTSTACRLQ